jgi:hypothetical protein
MTAYCRLQQAEFELEEKAGYRAVKHQRFVGTGYFDQVAQTIASGQASTVALAGSTESAQFAEKTSHCSEPIRQACREHALIDSPLFPSAT